METVSSNHATHVLGSPLTAAAVESFDTELLIPDIDKRILKIRPMSTPIDQISRSARPRTTASMEVMYYAVDNRPYSTQATAVAAADESGDFTIVLASKQDSKIFTPSDTVLLSSGSPGEKLHTFYVKEAVGKNLSCTYIGPDETFDAESLTFSAESKVIRMGRAAGELDVQTPPTTFIPRPESNFCQIFKAQIEQGSLLSSGLKKADVTFTDQQEAAIIDMRMGMERNFLFGAKRKLTSPDGNIYFTGGIWNQIPRSFSMPASFNTRQFLDLCREAFTGHAGASRKVLIGGSRCIQSLVVPGNNATVKQVGAVETEVHWGLNLKVISSNFGTLYVVHSETFDLCGHSGEGIIIDPEYLQKYTHIPFSAMRLDLKKSGQRNTDAVVLTEASCLVLRYPEAHMRLVTSTASSSSDSSMESGNDSGESE